jgi:hypothetical protein
MSGDGKIFAIGLSRTGTLSLTRALATLGIEVQHYPNDPQTQAELKTGRYRLTVLERVQALTDIPVAPFYPQLDAAYDGSKFILTTRDTDAWLASVDNHFRMYLETRRDAFDDFVLACVYGSLEFSAERFRYVKEHHEESVRRYFAGRPDRLLVLDISRGEGWDELCDFLGRPVPSMPYPHENKALARPARPRPARRSPWYRLLKRTGRHPPAT